MPASDTANCTLSTCPIDSAFVDYQPSIPANALFIGVFSLLLLLQLGLGLWYRTWSFVIAMSCGLILEVLGYIGRLILHHNPFNFSGFLMYLIPLTIGPAFFSAAIYLCLAKIVKIYGEGISRIRPRMYTLIFISCDLLSLILQAAGGAITSTADTQSLTNTGINIMIAGLAFQVFSLALFICLSAEFLMRVRRHPKEKNPTTGALRESMKWKWFLFALTAATVTIFVRSIFRVAELQGGFDSSLANDQTALMVLESTMIAIACICLTGGHPAVIMNRNWNSI
ncbi:RTA1 domain protein [Penicillium chermesinum]|uniref:RTA1 domain protein n=1 Tax=Penicillium chermesinum TaxID=63820 RepID=A0A9W9PJ90_9EURO|nr:RTA1 domain protein [Penicillium chermesinum]KAJ5247785.1 RTA1 domain protein [Penicillium chermesinum]KAJ6151547.1 RTA1 domain protein [Penicillium chermesinum]